MFQHMFCIGCFLLCMLYDVASNSTNIGILKRKVRQIKGCVLPPYPSNGHWIILNGKGNPGDIVSNNSILEFGCNNRYKLSDENKHAICFNGWNREKMPECESLCEPQFSTSTTFLQCFNKIGNEVDCKEATNGSYMKYDCRPFYEPTPGQRRIIYCTNGLWSNEKPDCTPICGQKNDAMSLIYGGNILNKLIYPWAVAVFKKDTGRYENVCGGTIIHRKAVLTAAHCVTDKLANVHPEKDYFVAAAKLYSKYEDIRDKDVQYLKISQFIVHPQYKREGRKFMGDIALIVTQKSFQLNTIVRPVCISDLSTIILRPGNVGEIVGWGVTETALPAEELRSLKIPYKNDEICVQEFPKDWTDEYDVTDKMCAGYPERNVSVCKGDSGCGLTFKNPEDNRYYVHGIVSLAPISTENSCNILTNALYTKVSFYYDFLDREINRLDRCILPKFPKDGMWILLRSPNKVPGDVVSPYDIIEITCKKGYNLTQPNSKVNCETLVSNFPFCVSTGERNKPFPEQENFTILEDEMQQKEFISISEECGKKVNGSNSGQFDDGEIIQHLDHPWVVVIYQSRKFKAHGTIISRKLVISAARFLCIWDIWIPIDPEEVSVVTGKYFSNYADSRDFDVQYYGADKIIIYNGFKGVKDGLYGDIGLVVIKGIIEFNEWVKPICVNGFNNIIMRPGSILEIVGWVNNENVFTNAAHTNQVVLKTIGRCLRETEDLGSYLSQDAICGGAASSSVCVRDHGTGLMYKNPADERYYLAVIFAFSLSNCTGNNTIYVSVKYHYDFIVEHIKKYS